MMDHLNPDELRCPKINKIPSDLVSWLGVRRDEPQRVDIKSVLVQIFLNFLFRCEDILKRIDFVMHTLKISDPLWNYLKASQ